MSIESIQLREQFARLPIRFQSSGPVRQDTDSDGKAWPHFLYTFTFYNDHASITETYRYDAKRPERNRIPHASEVFSCLCYDASSARDQSFDDWADSLVYDKDSRKAERIYRKCFDLWISLSSLVDATTIRALADLHSKL
jgi:hypothetical protein